METIYRIHKLGFQIKEIPIIFENRAKGKSKLATSLITHGVEG